MSQEPEAAAPPDGGAAGATPAPGVRRGVLAHGTYLPTHRLRRECIAEALGVPAGDGTRAVASHDEDTTTLGVEAARAAVAGAPRAVVDALGAVLFATTRPAYLEKGNANAIHAALALPTHVCAYDALGAVRSGIGAWRAAMSADAPTLVVLSDIRTGRPGGADERDGGDGAVALVCGPERPGAPVIAELVGSGTATVELLDRWRLPSESVAHVWDERFGEHAYRPLGMAAVGDALDAASLAPEAVDHVVVTGTHSRAVRALRRSCGFREETLADDLVTRIGNTGTAHPALLLVSVLERAGPGETILVIVVADGVDALVFRTTDALAELAPTATVEQQIAWGRDGLSYNDFLTWREMVTREPPRRPRPAPPAAPPSRRSDGWKFALTGSRCLECGTVQLPPARVCSACHAVDRMAGAPVADRGAVVAAFAVDRLADSLSPPLTTAVLDFDGGGRFECEVTDVDGATLAIGDRMEMTFRRLFTAEGVHDYFWKARPARGIG